MFFSSSVDLVWIVELGWWGWGWGGREVEDEGIVGCYCIDEVNIIYIC